MSGLRLVGEPELDEVELRARLLDAITGCVTVADALVDHVLASSADPYTLALATSYQDVRRTANQIRSWLSEFSG